MNQQKYRLKDTSIRKLTIENTQAIIMWSFRLIHPNNTKSPSYITFRNTIPLKVKIVIFRNPLETSFKKNWFKNDFPLKEKLGIDDALKSLLTKVVCKKVDITEVKLNKENTEMFLVRNLDKIYCSDTKFIPTNSKIQTVDISQFTKFTGPSNYFLVSIDCEMLQTEIGQEIGRVSLVDCNNKIIYDKFVRPENLVVDYLTQFSGLTCENVEYGISLSQLNEDLKTIIGKDTIIVGHSLESDLVALKIFHKKIIDTSHIFAMRNGRKEKLRSIVERIFNKKIQENEHSSVEDAKACIDLLKFKIEEMRMHLNSRELICRPRKLEYLILNVEENKIVSENNEKFLDFFDGVTNNGSAFDLKIFDIHSRDFGFVADELNLNSDSFVLGVYCTKKGDVRVLF